MTAVRVLMAAVLVVLLVVEEVMVLHACRSVLRAAAGPPKPLSFGTTWPIDTREWLARFTRCMHGYIDQKATVHAGE